MKTAFLLALSASLSQAYSVYQNQQQQQQSQYSIWQIIEEINQTSTFVRATENFPNIRDVLAGNATSFIGEPVSNVTAFVPINSAFGNIPTILQQLFTSQPVQRIQNTPLFAGQSRQASNFLEGVLAYHIANTTFIVPNNTQLANAQNVNTTLTTLADPYNVTVYVASPSFTNNNVRFQQAEQQGQQILQSNPQLFEQQVYNTTGLYVNDANVLFGVSAKNGIVYLIDSVISPLWYLNVSLADLPKDLTIPQMIQISKV